jgi:uncharacterized protein
MHFILFYDLDDQYAVKRQPYRKEHLDLIQKAYDAGQLVLAGALAEPSDNAVLVFRGPDASAAEAFAKSDPYVLNEVVTGWRVRKWATVVGDGASMPVLN